MKLIKYLAFILVLLTSSMAFTQVRFEVKVDKDTVGPYESIRVEFVLNTDGNNFIGPNLDNFEKRGGPFRKVENTRIDGVRGYQESFTYHLIPKEQGSLVIGNASINVDDKTYSTKPLTIEVNDKYIGEEQKLYLIKLNQDVHLVAEVSNNTLTLGNTTEVTYKLYVSHDVGVSGWKALEKPDYIGFEAEEIELKPMAIKTATFKDKTYRCVVLNKAKLTSKEKGEFQPEPFKLNITVEVPSGGKDIFGSPMTQTLNETIENETFTIVVK